jgi:PAS domain S-box-containing protein
MKKKEKIKKRLPDDIEELKNQVANLRRLKKKQISLYEISEAAHSAKSLEELYKKIHQIIEKLMPAKHNFYIALYDDAHGLLKFPYFVDQEEHPPPAQKLGRGLTEYVLETGEALLAPQDKFEEMEKKGKVLSVGPPSVDWLGVPLKIRDKTIGVLAVQSYEKGIRYTEEDKDVLNFVSEQIATAISRKQSEEELEVRNALFQLVVNNSPSGVFIVDDHYKLSYVNRKFCEILGYKEKELVGRDFRDFLARGSLELVTDRYKKRQKGEKVPSKYEFKIIRKDGESRLIEIVSGVIKTSLGRVQTVPHIRDITEERKMEQQLKESETRYKNLVEKARIAILIDDRDGNLKYFNDRLCEIFGYTRRELEKKKNCELVHPDDLEKVINLHKNRVAGKKVKSSYEFKGIKKDGAVIFCEVEAVALREKERITGTRSYIRDITESKRDKKKIEDSLREKEVLLREIHHRVKNNMQVISSLLTLQSREIEDKKILEIFEESRRRIRTMAMVHEKLYGSMDLSKIDVSKYISSLSQFLFHSFGIDSDRIVLKEDVENILLDINMAIPFGLLVNELISNSLKHAFPKKRRGEVRISLTKTNNNWIKLVVSDNGVGVKNKRELTKPSSFGLQLVKMLTEQLHGDMEIKTNKETSFIITFKELKYSSEL